MFAKEYISTCRINIAGSVRFQQKLREQCRMSTYHLWLRPVVVFFRGSILTRITAYIVRARRVVFRRPGEKSRSIEIIEFVNTIDLYVLTRRDISMRNRRLALFVNVMKRCQPYCSLGGCGAVEQSKANECQYLFRSNQSRSDHAQSSNCTTYQYEVSLFVWDQVDLSLAI